MRKMKPEAQSRKPEEKGNQCQGERVSDLWLLASGLLLLFSCLLLSSCGSHGGEDDSTTTSSQPIVIAALPNSAKIGDTVTLQGVGFSVTFNLNIVVVGNVTAQALSHQFIPTTPAGAIEEITFTIPPNAQLGAGAIFVIVNDVVSNTIPFKVESP